MFKRRLVLALALMLALAIALGGVAAGQTTTELVYWWLLPGASNEGKTCAFLDDIYADSDTVWAEFKIDPPAAGTFTNGPLTVTISNLTTTSFDFTANIGVDAVVVKDGIDGASFFVYDGLTAPSDGATDPLLGIPRDVEVTLDTGLTTPGARAISHISFCYDVEEMIVKSGYKWHDLNADGVRDMDEPVLSGWSIYVDYNDNGMLDMGEPYDITRDDGYYEIVGIEPGTWKVREVLQDGWLCSYPMTSDQYGCYHEEEFVAGMTYPDNNFGNYQPVSVTACKLEDVDTNPATADDRIPVEGWTVYLIKDGVRQAPDQVTGEDGCYTWTGLMPGHTYGVGEEVPDNWYPWTPTEYDFGLALSGDAFSYTFINSEKVDVKACKLEDVDADPLTADDRIPVPGWPVHLTLNGDVIDEQVTGDDGCYTWTDLDPLAPPNYYDVHEEVLEGWFAWTPTDVTCDPIPSGGTCEVDFVNSQYATKSGYKWNDLNADGIWDEGEPVLSGWTIDMLYNGVVVASAVTDELGMYVFDMVMPGQTLLVCEVLQPNWAQTYPTMASGGVACPMGYGPYGYEITLLSGQVETDNNFGNYQLVSVTACKVEDVDTNPATTGDRIPVEGWTVYLIKDDVRQAPDQVTGEDGCYTWTGLMPGHTYGVGEEVPDNWYPWTPTEWDFGPAQSGDEFSYTFINSQKVNVTACKLEDVDADPLTDDDRIPVPGWPVQLTLNGDVIDEQVTGNDGCYTWTDLDPLAPPNYYDVHEEVLDGWFAWTPTDVTCDPIPSGGTCEVDFVNSQYAAKSGYKWNDLNMDGIWDMDEPVLSGWDVCLLTPDGQVVECETTDENGMYEFASVMPGQTFLVCEVLQPNWTQTYPTMASGGVACPMGYAPYGYEITLQSGEVETDNNFGNWYPPGCTYTQGYWKTHSSYGPAPYDPRWVTSVTPLGADTPFFASGQTWYQTFWTNPVGGNVYYILAHQWMAAMLNVENGADPTALGTTLMDAEALLIAYSPTRLIPRTSPDRALAIQYAYILDQFNNGMLPGGPPHCDDTMAPGAPSLTPVPVIVDLSIYR